MFNFSRHHLYPGLLVLVYFMLQGCAASPTNVEAIDILNPRGIQLPINSQLFIVMKPDDRSKVYTVKYLFDREYYFEEGELIHSAATKVFSRLSRSIKYSKSMANGHMSTLISGNTNVEIMGAKYKANATVKLLNPKGNVIRVFSAQGFSKSTRVNDKVAFENSYIEAFIKIINQIMVSDEFIQYSK